MSYELGTIPVKIGCITRYFMRGVWGFNWQRKDGTPVDVSPAWWDALGVEPEKQDSK